MIIIDKSIFTKNSKVKPLELITWLILTSPRDMLTTQPLKLWLINKGPKLELECADIEFWFGLSIMFKNDEIYLYLERRFCLVGIVSENKICCPGSSLLEANFGWRQTAQRIICGGGSVWWCGGVVTYSREGLRGELFHWIDQSRAV